MANREHVEIVLNGPEAVRAWRDLNPDCFLDLVDANLSATDLRGSQLSNSDFSGADLSGVNLRRAVLRNARFSNATFRDTNLREADLTYADLRGVNLDRRSNSNLKYATFTGANLEGATLHYAYMRAAVFSRANLTGVQCHNATFNYSDLSGAVLRNAHLSRSNFYQTDCRNADFTGALLEGASLVDAKIGGTVFDDCKVYGLSAWRLDGTPASQKNLRVTCSDEPLVTVDQVEVAQFVYMLLNNEHMRQVIDTVTSKVVLILGRFTPERKKVLDGVRNALRQKNFVPIMFDFARSDSRDFTETIKTLAAMSRFVIADITNPSSCPLELQATVPDYMIPFVPLLQRGQRPFAMFVDLQRKYDWVLDVLIYDSSEDLVKHLEEAVVLPALRKHEELMIRKARDIRQRDIRDCRAST
jgi:uncharacterized protein YjbI with pentapeptide repeats